MLFLCLAQNFKGETLLREARHLGLRTVLVTTVGTRGRWDLGLAEEVFYLPTLRVVSEELLHSIGFLARHRLFSAIIPLDEQTVECAAHLREHLLLAGMSLERARLFRDKLAMRERANLPQPAFTGLIHHPTVHKFCQRVPAPWYLKPRSQAGSLGIQRLESERQLWPLLEELGDQQSHYLLEQAVDGPVFHVDSLVYAGQVVFAQVSAYGDSPFTIWNQGGVFSTLTVPKGDSTAVALAELNGRLLHNLGLERGVAHAEFIRCARTGHYHFLEVAARVGGANIDVLVEKASGVNLWREWLRMEVAALRGWPYVPPRPRAGYAGLLNCLARQEHPNLDSYDAPEVTWKLDKLQHAGLVVSGPDFEVIARLTAHYRDRFAQDFLAVLPPPTMVGRR